MISENISIVFFLLFWSLQKWKWHPWRLNCVMQSSVTHKILYSCFSSLFLFSIDFHLISTTNCLLNSILKCSTYKSCTVSLPQRCIFRHRTKQTNKQKHGCLTVFNERYKNNCHTTAHIHKKFKLLNIIAYELSFSFFFLIFCFVSIQCYSHEMISRDQWRSSNTPMEH